MDIAIPDPPFRPLPLDRYRRLHIGVNVPLRFFVIPSVESQNTIIAKYDPLTAHILHGLGEPLPVPPVLSAVYLGHDLLHLVESGLGVALHEMFRHAVPVLFRHLALHTPCLDLVQPVVHAERALRRVAKEPRAIGPRGKYRLELKGLDFEGAEWVNHGGRETEGSVSSVGVGVSRVLL